MQRRKIVVITPIKNESWILDKFLNVTSTFADVIIIADQFSSDNSVDICKKFPKVHLIKNEKKEFDEPYRQKLLINEARKVVTGEKVIFALDADEILTANSIDSVEWTTIDKSPPGTAIFFHKHDLYYSSKSYLYYDSPFPIAYIDDGAEHQPEWFHCTRIPIKSHTNKLYCQDIQFAHYALTRMSAQKSKVRMYSCIEKSLDNSNQLLNQFKRRKRNSRFKSYKNNAEIKATPHYWFSKWNEEGFRMDEICQDQYYSYDVQVLNMIEKHGSKKFWFDDIWYEKSFNFNLELCRQHMLSKNIENIPTAPLIYPNTYVRSLLLIFDFYIKNTYTKDADPLTK
jgi:hypothetical protein